MEPISYLRFFLALILVLGLIMGMAWLLKRLGLGIGATGPLTRRKRLRTIEATMIDGRHRVVLIRRDDVEHLVLIGPNTSQVIERSIPVTGPDLEINETSPITPVFRKFLPKDVAS